MNIIDGYVWCHSHGCVHDDTRDPYQYGVPDCDRADHEPVYMKEEEPHMSTTAQSEPKDLKDLADSIMEVRDDLLELPAFDNQRQILLEVRDQLAKFIREPDGSKTPRQESHEREVVSPETFVSPSVPVGTRVAKARKQRGMTLTELSETTGLAPVSIRKIELGETKHPRHDTLIALEQTLGIGLIDSR